MKNPVILPKFDTFKAYDAAKGEKQTPMTVRQNVFQQSSGEEAIKMNCLKSKLL